LAPGLEQVTRKLSIAGYTFADLKWKPRLGLQLDAAYRFSDSLVATYACATARAWRNQ
jgi:hypothetical protein